MFALDLYFELDVNSEEFERGVKQVNTDRPFYFFISTVNNKKQMLHMDHCLKELPLVVNTRLHLIHQEVMDWIT